MQFRHRADLLGTDQHVHHPHYETVRLLLARDDVGVSVTDITLVPRIAATYGYADRTEVAYCLDGVATVRDLNIDTEHRISPGSLWVAPPGARFTFRADVPTRLICVFTPALTGDETGVIDPAGSCDTTP